MPSDGYSVRPTDPAAARELGRACGVGATTAQVLLHRGMGEVSAARSWLDARLDGLTPPDGMAGRDEAAERIVRAITARERVVVFGDYDVDGATATTILSDVIELLGGDVQPLLANRFEGGYGFSGPALARCREAGATLIVTCDCGSSDHERIADARRAGIDVVVVDHHLVPKEPLPALAFLNPHRPDCGFPYEGLCSAGLALSVAAAVRRRMGATLDLRAWLDLVALGTVADVAPLDGDNRRLVRAGLRLLSSPSVRPGVAALRELAGIKPGAVVGSVDIAFRLAPRLNAAGRLGAPDVTLALLRARQPAAARALAARVEQLNDERKAIERRITEEACAQALELYGESPSTGIVVAGDGWHRGVVGITAARLVDRFGVPAVAISVEDGVGHGSCRAPDDFPLYDAVQRCADVLVKFGGHQAAAGLSVAEARVRDLREAFAEATRREPGLFGAGGPRLVDAEIDGEDFEVPPLADLLRLEPVGERNVEPLFALPDAQVRDKAVVGQGHLKLDLAVGRRRLRAFGWDLGGLADTLGARVTPVGHFRADTWRGGEAVELRLVDVC